MLSVLIFTEECWTFRVLKNTVTRPAKTLSLIVPVMLSGRFILVYCHAKIDEFSAFIGRKIAA